MRAIQLESVVREQSEQMNDLHFNPRRRLNKRRSAVPRIAIAGFMAVVFAGCFGDRVGEIPVGQDALIDEIFKAAKYENAERARALINAGALTNRPDLLGWTPLHYAVNRLRQPAWNEIELIEVMASAPGTHVDAADNSGLKPVFLAAKYGSVEVLELLGKHGADLDARDDDGFTLLMTAVANRKIEMAKHLIERGADVETRLSGGGTALFMAIRSQTPELVSLLIEHGANVRGNEQASEPIIFAAALQNEDVVRLLIEAGADVNAVNRNNGLTPLHRAIASGPTMVNLLLKAGARADVSDRDGVLPLDLAREAEDAESIRMLTEKAS